MQSNCGMFLNDDCVEYFVLSAFDEELKKKGRNGLIKYLGLHITTQIRTNRIANRFHKATLNIVAFILSTLVSLTALPAIVLL